MLDWLGPPASAGAPTKAWLALQTLSLSQQTEISAISSARMCFSFSVAGGRPRPMSETRGARVRGQPAPFAQADRLPHHYPPPVSIVSSKGAPAMAWLNEPSTREARKLKLYTGDASLGGSAMR